MVNTGNIVRPTFAAASSAWTSILAERGLPTDLTWIFDENLCFEGTPGATESFHLGFQTQFSPTPPDADRIAYEYFRDFPLRVVFYRLGTHAGKSVCLLLCDEWFESRGGEQGFIRRDDWGMSFRPGTAGEIEEITDEQRWKGRIVKNRPLHDLDFCMTLRAVHEILAHGRVLNTYEHYALRLFDAWRRLVGEKG